MHYCIYNNRLYIVRYQFEWNLFKSSKNKIFPKSWIRSEWVVQWTRFWCLFWINICIDNIPVSYNVNSFEIACFIKETKKKFRKSEKLEKFKKN